MARNRSMNLETYFEKLCLATERDARSTRPFKRITYLAYLRSGIMDAKRCREIRKSYFRDYNKESTTRRSVLRPARLHLSSLSKKSIRIRPSKLNVKESNLLLLKPATLIFEDKYKPLTSSKFGVTRTSTTLPGVTFSVGQVFSNDKLKSQKSFKSLRTNDDAEISKAFDTLSFKKLRQMKDPPSSEVSAANKCDNTSSSSVQAIAESCVPNVCDDDTSIEELANYFDLFVHIPRKMSTMAEMMYV